MGCSKKHFWKRWGQQLSLQLAPVPPRGQSLLFPLPNFPIPRASSNFFAASQVQELGNWDFSPNLALLCSAWPTCHSPWGAAGLSAPLVLLFQESGFCAQCYHGALKLSWHTLGILVQKLFFLCFSSTQGTAALPGAWQSSHTAAWRGSASPEWAHSPGLCEHRQALLCLQSLRDGFCSRSRPPIQVQVLLAPVKLSDKLWAGRVPCEQMGWLSWQPRAWDAQLAEGNGSWAPRCSCPNACPCWSYPGRSRPRGVWNGVSQQRWYPTFCPGLLLLHHWGRGSSWGAFSLSSPLGTAGTCHHPVSSRDSPWRQQHSSYFFNYLC